MQAEGTIEPCLTKNEYTWSSKKSAELQSPSGVGDNFTQRLGCSGAELGVVNVLLQYVNVPHHNNYALHLWSQFLFLLKHSDNGASFIHRLT